jgi:hypothetical protein
MAHLVDRLLTQLGGEPEVAPVLAHLGVDEILVDRRQLVGEELVEECEYFLVTLHRSAFSPRSAE